MIKGQASSNVRRFLWLQGQELVNFEPTRNNITGISPLSV